MVRTWCFCCWSPGSVRGQGTKILQTTWHGHKKKKKKDKGPTHTEMWKTDIQETKKKAQSLNSGRDFSPHLQIYYRYVMYTFTNTSRVLMTLQYVQLTIMVY